jgi:hypothetical protein
LILAVVLTSLLAIVGVLFVLLSRMDKVSASASSQDRHLGMAVDAVIATINDRLVQDTPGVGKGTGQPSEKYYDYPDPCNPWLACLEPERDAGNVYRWAQVSDLTPSALTRTVRSLRAEDVLEHETLTHPPGPADADGDGVADANWFVLDSVRSSKGRPIYAAVRIVDHGAMLNVNTAWDVYSADPNLCDGSHQMQIDLTYLAQRGNNAGPGQELAGWRGHSQTDWRLYLKDVVWRFGNPPAPYTPFDISDELKLRYRYVLNLDRVTSRIEKLWLSAFDGGIKVPITSGGQDLDNWARKVIYSVPVGTSSPIDPNYDFRHIGTVYSLDRIIDPCGQPMVNVNNADAASLYRALQKGGVSDVHVAAQLVANILDFTDVDSTPTAFEPNGSSVTYYGLEPQPFIRQIGFKIAAKDPDNHLNNEFMVELHNPYDVDIDLSSFILHLLDPAGKRSSFIDFKSGERIKARKSFVLLNKDPASVGQGFADRKPYEGLVLALFTKEFALSQRLDLLLVRRLGTAELRLDLQRTMNVWFDWNQVKDRPQYYARANGGWNILYPNMQLVEVPSLSPSYNLPQAEPILPALGITRKGFVTVGDIGRVFRIGPDLLDPNAPNWTAAGDNTVTSMIQVLGQTTPPSDPQVCLNLAEPRVAGVFQYLTVLAPQNFGGDLSGSLTTRRGSRSARPSLSTARRMEPSRALPT